MTHFYYSWCAQQTTVDFPVERTERDEFILTDGKRVYDFISTSFQANFGHRFEPICSRMVQQLKAMPIASPKSSFDLKEDVSRRLTDLIDLDGGKIFYTVSGAEAVENALKIARQITGRPIIAARQKSYHGASLGALSVTGDWRNGPHLTFDEGTLRIPEYEDDPELVRTEKLFQRTGPEQIAAVILETISGTNGMAIPTSQWIEGIQNLCRKYGCLLILDEVLVGFGRCGTDFAFHQYAVEPDLICMSKAISGGFIPLGAVWTSQKIAEYYESQTLSCGLTNYAHPVGLAALDGVLASLSQPDFRQSMEDLETCLGENLARLRQLDAVTEVRQRGLMSAISLNHSAPTWEAAFQEGLHLFSKENLILLAPPYISSPRRLESAINQLKELISCRG